MSRLPSLLIVDDEEDLCEVLSKMFDRLNYETAASTSVRGALELLSTRAFDLILSDVRMPVADGIELLEQLCDGKSIPPNIFLMSGFLDIELPEALHRGALGLFQKPLDFKVIDMILRRSLEPVASRWLHAVPRPLPLIARSMPVTFSEYAAGGGIELGRGGFFWREAGMTVRAGDVVEFSLSFGANEKFCGHGEVVWSRDNHRAPFQPGCGIQIHSLAESALALFLEASGSRVIKSAVPIGLVKQYR